jgi:hypothetical protein
MGFPLLGSDAGCDAWFGQELQHAEIHSRQPRRKFFGDGPGQVCRGRGEKVLADAA